MLTCAIKGARLSSIDLVLKSRPSTIELAFVCSVDRSAAMLEQGMTSPRYCAIPKQMESFLLVQA